MDTLRPQALVVVTDVAMPCGILAFVAYATLLTSTQLEACHEATSNPISNPDRALGMDWHPGTGHCPSAHDQHHAEGAVGGRIAGV